jgi:hypothetical protein
MLRCFDNLLQSAFVVAVLVPDGAAAVGGNPVFCLRPAFFVKSRRFGLAHSAWPHDAGF